MTKADQVIEVAKAAPPVTVTGLTMFGFPVNEIVLVITGIYSTLLLFFLVKDKLVPWLKSL